MLKKPGHKRVPVEAGSVAFPLNPSIRYLATSVRRHESLFTCMGRASLLHTPSQNVAPETAERTLPRVRQKQNNARPTTFSTAVIKPNKRSVACPLGFALEPARTVPLPCGSQLTSQQCVCLRFVLLSPRSWVGLLRGSGCT